MRITSLIFSLTLIYSSNAYSQQLFSADFRAPDPPSAIIAEYQASYVQHKWDETGISHIGSGMIYAGLSIGRLRMDIMYNGNIVSSLFDYSKVNPDGSIPNCMYVLHIQTITHIPETSFYVLRYTLSPSVSSNGTCAFFNVTPAFPLFPPNILVQSQSTFGGLVQDDLFYATQGPLPTWNLIFGSSTSVRVFLSNNTLVR